MILYTQCYQCDDAERHKELNFCRSHNRQNKAFSRTVILDGSHKRITYQEFIDHANRNFPNKTIVIANSDIYFDETIGLLSNKNLNGLFLALTRVEPFGGFNFDGQMVRVGTSFKLYSGSQDVWIFRAPIALNNADLELGVQGCDNRITFEAVKSGLKVFNWALDIHCYHKHAGSYRTWQDKKLAYQGGRLLPKLTFMSDMLPDYTTVGSL